MTLRHAGDNEIRRVAESIVDYLARNPEASDTVDGISLRWVEHDKSLSREVLLCALEGLVAEGRLEKCELANGHCLWRKGHAA